jgi:hypothetical protein
VAPAVNPVIELVNVPLVVPSVVLLSDMVGVAVVLQQIPETVIAEPPLDVIVPPALAAYFVIPEAAEVVIVGAIAIVAKLVSVPYTVPTLLVANDLTK